MASGARCDFITPHSPDIAHAVKELATHMTNPTERGLAAVEQARAIPQGTAEIATDLQMAT